MGMPNGGWIFPRNSAWVGCLVFAAPTWLGMIFGDWISTNRSLFWGWGANCQFPKDQCHPSPALPINGIDGEGERGGGFNRVLNHFEGRRPSPFQAHATALRLWFPPPASGARGEDYGEGRSQTASAINEPSHFPKARRHPSPALPINGIDGEGERGGGFNWVLNRFEGRRLWVTLSKTETRPRGVTGSFILLRGSW